MGGLKGIDNVMRNLNREVLKMKGRSMAGLIQAAIVIRRDMDKTPPLIPVDVGNLRASYFTTTSRGALGPSLTMGFSANYAAAVETKKQKNPWKRPNSGPHFFESSLKRNAPVVLKIIANSVKI